MASMARLLDGDLTAILRAKEDFDINRAPFILEAWAFQLYLACQDAGIYNVWALQLMIPKSGLTPSQNSMHHFLKEF